MKIPKAPFPYHIFVFHSDGTLLQANPDAGDASTSDSNGAGASRGEISFRLKVSGNTLAGTFNASFYNAEERRLREPFSGALDGQRVLP